MCGKLCAVGVTINNGQREGMIRIDYSMVKQMGGLIGIL
jgi:hypothetical protein